MPSETHHYIVIIHVHAAQRIARHNNAICHLAPRNAQRRGALSSRNNCAHLSTSLHARSCRAAHNDIARVRQTISERGMR